jgi:hypothetical protein
MLQLLHISFARVILRKREVLRRTSAFGLSHRIGVLLSFLRPEWSLDHCTMSTTSIYRILNEDETQNTH